MGEDGRLDDRDLDALLGSTEYAPLGRGPTNPDRDDPAYRRPAPDPAYRRPAADHDHPTRRRPASDYDDPGATEQTSAGADVLGHGPDRATLTERAADQVRRHRRISAVVVVAALVVAAGGLTWARARPATQAPGTAAAWYRPSLAAMTSVNVVGGVVTSTIYLQTAPGAPTPTAVSLTGQGLGGGVLTQNGPDVTVTSPLDCNTIGDLSAAARPAVLHVRHSGDDGAVVTEDLPLSLNPGTAGIPVADAVAALRRACVGQLSDALVLRGVQAATTASGEVLTLQVTNPTGHDLVLLGAQTTLAPSDASIGAPATAGTGSPAPEQGALLPVGATTSVTLPVVRTNCADHSPGAGTSAGLGAGPGRPTGDFALWISPSGPVTYPRDDSWTARELSPVARAAVVRALSAPCVGAPALSYEVAAVRAGAPGSGTVTFLVSARSTGGRLSISGQGALGNLLSVAVAPLASGTGRLDVQVQMSYSYCATGFDQILPPPPVLSLQARVGANSYPFQLAVGNRTVLDAFGRACGQQPDLALAQQAGWDS